MRKTDARRYPSPVQPSIAGSHAGSRRPCNAHGNKAGPTSMLGGTRGSRTNGGEECQVSSHRLLKLMAYHRSRIALRHLRSLVCHCAHFVGSTNRYQGRTTLKQIILYHRVSPPQCYTDVKDSREIIDGPSCLHMVSWFPSNYESCSTPTNVAPLATCLFCEIARLRDLHRMII